MPRRGGRAAPGWGTLLDAAPLSGLAGRIVIVIAKAVGSYAAAVNEVSVVEFYPALRVNGRD
jgi:hypothetical protein